MLREVAGDDGKLLEGRADVIGLVVSYDGRLAETVEHLGELVLGRDVIWKSKQVKS